MPGCGSSETYLAPIGRIEYRVEEFTSKAVAEGVRSARHCRPTETVKVDGMGQQFEELPEWEFTTDEFAPGAYRVVAVRNGGITGDSHGTDLDSALVELRNWAQSVEQELAEQTEYEATVSIEDSPGEQVVVRAMDIDKGR